MMSGEDEDDEPPFASPEIQLAYEAALGRFILSFNNVDDKLTGVIYVALDRLGRQELLPEIKRLDFWAKLLVFQLLMSSSEGPILRKVPVDLMKHLQKARNELAHGYFDQNPFDGSYDIWVRRGRRSYPIEKVDCLAVEAETVLAAFRGVIAQFEFSDPVP